MLYVFGLEELHQNLSETKVRISCSQDWIWFAALPQAAMAGMALLLTAAWVEAGAAEVDRLKKQQLSIRSHSQGNVTITRKQKKAHEASSCQALQWPTVTFIYKPLG